MADVTVTINELIRTNEPSESVEGTLFSANDTVKVPFISKNMIIGISLESDGDVVFDKGNGIAGINDLTVSCTASEFTFIQLDSSSFEFITGEDEGYVTFTPEEDGMVVAVNAL